VAIKEGAARHWVMDDNLTPEEIALVEGTALLPSPAIEKASA